MPRFVGRGAPTGATQIENNAREPVGYARLTYSQMVKLSPADVVYSLDTTDRGSRGARAKRWYRWFGRCEAILSNPSSTSRMRERAS